MGTVPRHEVHFSSGGARCAAWHYPGSGNGCVVMAAGTAIPKEPGTDRFARRFVEAGFTVLAFDFRHLGASGGLPRNVVRVREQLADWDAALAHAATLPGLMRVTSQAVAAKPKRFGKDPFSGEERWFPAKPASVRVKVRALKKVKDAAL